MTKQIGRRSLEAQPEPSLPISLGVEVYPRGLQNFVESFGAIGQRRKVTTVFVLAQWAGKPIEVKDSGERFFKVPFRHN